MTQVLYFFIYSFLGWVCECIYCGIGARRFINRGFLEGPYCPIYGWGALIVLYALEPFKNNLVLLFFAGMILTSLLEYATSVVMEKMFHSTWWDYSNRRFNLNGRICLRNSVMFGVMGVVVVRIIHPVIDSFLIKIRRQFRSSRQFCLWLFFFGIISIRFMRFFVKTKIIACWKIVCVN